MDVKKLYWKAFWCVTGGFALMFVLFFLLVDWIFLGFKLWPSLAAAAFLIFVLAPLTAWRMVEKIAGDDVLEEYHRIWELNKLVRVGKDMMFWGLFLR